MTAWTLQKILNSIADHLKKGGVDSPRLSAELLLSHVLGMKRIELYARADTPISKQQIQHLDELTKRAGQHEPIAYLTGKTEFYSLALNVTRDCMIPRPETELLVERAIEFLRTSTGTQWVCDLCTGSGCIAVAIAKNCPAARIIATDISADAIKVAAQNVEAYQLDEQVKLVSGDLFEPVKVISGGQQFDLIVCNPPYVSAAEYEALPKTVRDYEPRLALFAGSDGLDICRRIITEAGDFLKPEGALMLEIGYAQGPAVTELLQQAGAFSEIKIQKDLRHNDRLAIARRALA
jgi:release factor glutamine methyltransferase